MKKKEFLFGITAFLIVIVGMIFLSYLDVGLKSETYRFGLSGAAVGSEENIEANLDAQDLTIQSIIQCGNVSHSITLAQNITYNGSDQGGTVSCINITANNTVFDCNGYWLIGPNNGSSSTNAAIHSVSTNNVTVKNCNFRGFNPRTINLESETNWTITGNNFTQSWINISSGSNEYIYAVGTGTVNISHNRFENYYADTGSNKGPTPFAIANNHHNSYIGYNFIKNITSVNNQNCFGISSGASANVTVTNNQFHDYSCPAAAVTTAFLTQGAGTNFTHNLVNNSVYGILFISSQCYAFNNTFYNLSLAGLAFSSATTNVVVNNTYVNITTCESIGTSTSVNISGSTYTNCTTDISVTSSTDINFQSGMMIDDIYIDSNSNVTFTNLSLGNGSSYVTYLRLNANTTNTTRDLKYGTSWLFINSTGSTGLNHSANITFTGLNYLWYNITKDGENCSECNKLSTIPIIFQVSQFSNYSVQEASACGAVTASKTLFNNVTYDGSGITCINITANNTVFDCNGYWLLGPNNGSDSSNAAIYSKSTNNITVKNCNFKGFNPRTIDLSTESNWTIYNNNFTQSWINVSTTTNEYIFATGTGTVNISHNRFENYYADVGSNRGPTPFAIGNNRHNSYIGYNFIKNITSVNNQNCFGISSGASANVTVTNNQFHDYSCPAAAVTTAFLTQGVGTNFTHNLVNNSVYGILFISSQCYAFNNTFYNLSLAGIAFSSATTNVLVNSTYVNITTCESIGTSTSVNISGSTYANCTTDISVTSSTDINFQSGMMIDDIYIDSNSNVTFTNLSLGNGSSYATYLSLTVSLNATNTTADLQYGTNWLSINATGSPGLNRTANITFLDISYASNDAYSVLKDGSVCSDCTELGFSPVIFQVVQFSNYSVDAVPTILLASPAAAYYNDTSASPTINFTCNATDDVELVNISLYLSNSSNQSLVFNRTVSVNGTSNSTNWSVTFSVMGNYSWNCLVTDSAGNTDWDNNRSFILNYTAPTTTTTTTSVSSGESDSGAAPLSAQTAGEQAEGKEAAAAVISEEALTEEDASGAEIAEKGIEEAVVPEEKGFNLGAKLLATYGVIKASIVNNSLIWLVAVIVLVIGGSLTVGFKTGAVQWIGHGISKLWKRLLIIFIGLIVVAGLIMLFVFLGTSEILPFLTAIGKEILGLGKWLVPITVLLLSVIILTIFALRSRFKHNKNPKTVKKLKR